MGILEVPAITEDGKSNWPERWPIDLLLAKKKEDPIAFSSQFMLQPVDLENSPLKEEWLHFYSETELPHLVHFIGVDPSPSGRLGTDYFALAVIGVDEERNGYLRSAYHLQIDPLAQVERIKAEASVWRPLVITIEAIAAQSLFTRYMFQGANLPIRESTTRFPKEVRYLSLVPLFSSGRIRIRGQLTAEGVLEPADSVKDFVDEWTNFPSGHDDVLDAVQKAVEAAQLVVGTPITMMVHPGNVPEGRSPSPALSSTSSARLRGPRSPLSGRRLRDSDFSFKGRRRLR